MRVTTADGSFGVLIERTDSPRFFRFRLLVGGEWIGDSGPCILGTAMYQLAHLARLDVDLVPSDQASAQHLLAMLKADDAWNDASLRPLAESMDAWDLRGFVTASVATFVARSNDQLPAPAATVWCTIAVDEYDALVGDVAAYWRAAQT